MRNLEILISLITKSHLTIGKSVNNFIQSSYITQLKRKKDNLKRICIPATTIKGVLRSSAIQIAHFLLDGDKNYCKTVNISELCGNCLICSIFGANNKPSKIYCEDGFPIIKNNIELLNFTQISIERKTHTSKKGFIITKEQIPPGIEFETNIFGKNLNVNEESLLLFAIHNMNFCNFGKGNSLMQIRIKRINNYNRNSELIKKLICKMSYY